MLYRFIVVKLGLLLHKSRLFYARHEFCVVAEFAYNILLVFNRLQTAHIFIFKVDYETIPVHEDIGHFFIIKRPQKYIKNNTSLFS